MCYNGRTDLYGTGTWTLRKVDQEYFENFEMCCWKRIEISWTDRVRNELLHRVKKGRNVVITTKIREAN